MSLAGTAVGPALLAFALYVVGRLFQYVKAQRGRPPYPPGPPGLPLLGNLSAPVEMAHLVYLDWRDKYGSDVLRLHMLGTNIIVLNSYEAAVDLLEKRSAIYSDRPDVGMTMLCELCGLGWSFAFQRYGPAWREGRKAFQREFSTHAVAQFRPTELRFAHALLRNLLRSPEDFMDHVKHMTGGTILAVAYGIEVQEKDDPFLATAERVAAAVETIGMPGSHLVDLIPILKYVPAWFPGAEFQRKAQVVKRDAMDLLNKPYELLQRRAERDELPPCVAKSLREDVLANAEDPEETESIIKGVLGSMYLAGSDTTLSTLWSFFLAMVLHPDIRRRAQASIDAVCGDRLPDFSDDEALPYIHAIVLECMRWNPVVNVNLAHRSTEDDVYRGYYIPKDSIVISNTWAILHDPEAYPDPSQFDPERFLIHTGPNPADISLNPDVRNPMDVALGLGRRICPGRFMAYEEMWIVVASVLAAFDLDAVNDAWGNPVMPSGEYSYAFQTHPKPFKCQITPRSAMHRTWILETAGQPVH